MYVGWFVLFVMIRIMIMQIFGFILVLVLLKYLCYVEWFGLDIVFVLVVVGFQVDQFNDNCQCLLGEVYECLFGYFCEYFGDFLFGLYLVCFVQFGFWSVFGYIVMNCVILGEVMSCIMFYEKLVGDMGISCIEVVGGQVWLIWNCCYQIFLVWCYMVEYVLVFWVFYVCWIVDLEGLLDEVWLEYDLLDGICVEDYEIFFGCLVCFV